MIISVSALTAAITSSINLAVSIVSLVLCLVVVFNGIEWLKNVNFLLVPIIVLTLVTVSSFSIFSGEVFLSLTRPFVYNAFLYVGMNIFLASEVLVDASSDLTKKQKFVSALVSSVLFTIILFVLTLGFSFAKINSQVEMPILFMSKKMGKVFGVFYLFILWAGIFTTLISIVYSMHKKFEKTFGFKKGTTILFCLTAFGLSFFGFGNIVNVFYPLEGIAGVVYSLLVFLLVFVLKNENNNGLCFKIKKPWNHGLNLALPTGIEPVLPAWEASVLTVIRRKHIFIIHEFFNFAMNFKKFVKIVLKLANVKIL